MQPVAQPICPVSGRPCPRKLLVSGPVRQRIVDVIATRPHGVTRGQLMWLVYGEDPNGGPDSPNVVCVHIWHANKELRPQGYEITASRGRGSLYRLVKYDTQVGLPVPRTGGHQEVRRPRSKADGSRHPPRKTAREQRPPVVGARKDWHAL